MTEFEIEIRRADVSIRITGSSKKELLARVKEAVGILDDIALKTTESSSRGKGSKGVSLSSAGLVSDVPSITGVKTVREAILKVLSTDWGRTPKSQGEIRKALEVSALYYVAPVIANELRRMTRLGLLRRLPAKGGGFAYVLASPP